MRRIGIRAKLLVIVIPLIVVSYLFLALIANQMLRDEKLARAWKDQLGEAEAVAMQMNKAFANLSSCGKTIVRDLNYSENIGVLTRTAEGGLQAYNRERIVRSILENKAVYFPEAEALAFVDYAGNVYASDARMESGWNPESRERMLAPLLDRRYEDVWLPIERRDVLTMDPNEAIVTVARNIMNMTTGYRMGQLFILMRESRLRAFYQAFESEMGRMYLVVSPDGQIVSASAPDMRMQPLSSFMPDLSFDGGEVQQSMAAFSGVRSCVSVVRLQSAGLRLLSVSNLGMVTAEADRMTATLFVLCFATVAVGVILIGYSANRITRPLVLLARELGKVRGGNLKIEIPPHDADEVDELALNCQYMLERIRDDQEQKQQLRLALLQSQIKPHFLYNTLDLVFVCIKMRKYGRASEAVKALADYYRIALAGGRDNVLLEEELHNVDNYLKIQEMRYGDVFSYQIEVEEGIRDYLIPKLTLQPLVENAIYHGLRPNKARRGMLVVRGKWDDNGIQLRVEDNGVGMSAEKAASLLGDIQDEHHFGLHSVQERIRLCFGAEYGIQIESKESEGTTVIVRIGRLKEGKDDA